MKSPIKKTLLALTAALSFVAGSAIADTPAVALVSSPDVTSNTTPAEDNVVQSITVLGHGYNPDTKCTVFSGTSKGAPSVSEMFKACGELGAKDTLNSIRAFNRKKKGSAEVTCDVEVPRESKDSAPKKALNTVCYVK